MKNKPITDTLQIAYKILYALEHKNMQEYTGTLISPEAVSAKPEKWLDVMQNLNDDGLIAGIEITSDITGGVYVDIEHARITLKGAQYLKENSIMAKIGGVASNVINVGSIVKP